MQPWLSLLIAVLLVGLNGFFVAAEFALVKVRLTRIEELANEGKVAARMVRHQLRRLNGYLSACQAGITLASLGLGYVLHEAFYPLVEPLLTAIGLPIGVFNVASFVVPFLLANYAHIVIGEQAPKSWAIQRAERVALFVAYPLHGFYTLFYPLIWIVNASSELLLRLLRIGPAAEHELAHSEEELRMILTASGESGYLKDSEVDLVKHVFEFADKRAGDIAVPRVDMVYLDVTWPLERNLEIVNGHSFTRFPLCEGDPDHVIGMIHIKDLLQLARRGGGDLRGIAREIVTVPESKPIDALLREFQYRKMHMAIVLDEYGGTTGLATLEDVLEEIVGEIYDEFEEPTPEVQPLGNQRFLVDGRALLSDLKADHAIDIPPNGADTIGGFVLDKLGAIPQPGAVLEAGPYRLEVAEMAGQRVRKVLVEAPAAAEGKTTLPAH